MLSLMIDPAGAEPDIRIDIEAHGKGLDGLLVELLNNLLSAADLEDAAFTGIRPRTISSEGDMWAIDVSVEGVSRAGNRDRLISEVKAATGYGASVTRAGKDLWVAECVVDL
jgi:SHS2 domain-containing protein